METYGQTIARLREEHGWSQEDLARAAGVPKRTIQDIELDKVKTPQRRTRTKLAMALDIEGDAEETRQHWPNDIQAFLNTMGALLSNVDEHRRLELYSAIGNYVSVELLNSNRNHDRPSGDHHPNGQNA